MSSSSERSFSGFADFILASAPYMDAIAIRMVTFCSEIVLIKPAGEKRGR